MCCCFLECGPPPPTVDNAMSNHNGGNYNPGDTIEYNCNDDSNSSPSTSECMANGQWGPVMPALMCVPCKLFALKVEQFIYQPCFSNFSMSINGSFGLYF